MNEDGEKRPVLATIVKVLLHCRDDRGMTLEPYASRCVRRGDVHELVTTDHDEARAGSRIDRVGFLGFAEMDCGGVIDRGDAVSIDGSFVGHVLGFDACHAPNHLNVLILGEVPRSGGELNLAPEARVRFEPGPRSSSPGPA